MQPPDFIAQQAPPESPKGAPRPWWESRTYVAFLILLALVPLAYPRFPPLVDLPGHMGRYQVAVDGGAGQFLKQWYEFAWRPLGNLGVDVLAVPLAHLVGVELATKLVVMAIPALAVAGMLWVAREVHNRLPPTVAFALPIAFSHPFLYGFANFALSMALALLALGLWLRLGRLGKTRLRAIVFVPLSFVVFFAHTFGWGTMGLICFSAEAVRQHDKGLSWWKAGLTAAAHAMVMALPALAIVGWRTEAAGSGLTIGWFRWSYKWEYLQRILRDRWQWWDLASVAIMAAVPLFAIIDRRLALSRNLLFSGLVLAAGFVCLPRVIFGSAYADMRLAPYVLAIMVLAIRFKRDTDVKLARALAIAGLAFLLARTASVTASMAIAANRQAGQLRALEQLPRGARVVSQVYAPCNRWPLRRSDHLPGMIIVRKDGFSNDQWKLPGASLLTVHYPAAGWFQNDPSEIVRYPGCLREGASMRLSLRAIPRDAFDYLWLVDLPPIPREWVAGWEPVFANEGSILLKRSDGAQPPPATPRTEAAAARRGASPTRTAGRADG